MSYGSEADEYNSLAESPEFHEANIFASDDEGEKKIVLVDIDETVAFYSGVRKYK